MQKYMSSEKYLVEKERADELVRRGELAAAIEAYDAAIKDRPQFWGAHYFKAEALLKLERFHDAATAFWSASLYARGRPEPALMAGRALFRAEFYIDACSAFELVDINQIDPDSALQYAICLLKNDKAAEAFSLKDKFTLCENKSAARLLLVDIYLSLKRFVEAAELISTEIQHNGENHTNLNLLARAKFGAGEMKDAETAIKAAISKSISEIKAGTMRFAKKEQTHMSVSDGNDVLRDVCEVLQRNNINYFLDGGTLLGIMRDGDLLPYDKDMDIGIFPETTPEQVYSLFENRKGYTCKRPESAYEEEQQHWNIVVINTEKNITIDLFYFHKIDNCLWNGFYNPYHPVMWRRSIFELAKHTHQGAYFMVPEDYKIYLSEMYGEKWMVPDQYFQSAVSALNLHPNCVAVSQVFGLLKVYDALCLADYAKANSIFNQVQRCAPVEASYALKVYKNLLEFTSYK